MEKRRDFKIALLEDNHFYNAMLTAKLKGYTGEIADHTGIDFQILSYTNPHDFIANIPDDTNVAIVDYYLGDSLNGIDVLNQTAWKCRNCKVVIISKTNNFKTSLVTLLEGASGFILKDRNALSNTCIAVEDIMRTQGYL